MAPTVTAAISPPEISNKAIEDYLRRYEDQSLRALENHSNSIGHSLIGVYALWLAPGGAHLTDESFRPWVLLALYGYMAFNMYVAGSLTKRIFENTDQIRRIHPGAEVLWYSSFRFWQAGPLGPLQWLACVTARQVASGSNTFGVLVSLLFASAIWLLMLAFLVAPFVEVMAGTHHDRLAVLILVPAFLGLRLFFRFSRGYMSEIRSQVRERVGGPLAVWIQKAFLWLADRFDRELPGETPQNSWSGGRDEHG